MSCDKLKINNFLCISLHLAICFLLFSLTCTCFTGANIEVCFCYFDHQHILRAQSPTLTLVNPSPNANGTVPLRAAAASSELAPFDIQIYGKFGRGST